MGMGDVVISVSSAVAASMQRRGVPSHKLRVVKNGPLGSPRRSVQFLPDNRTIRHPAIVTVAGLLRNKGISDLITAFALVSSKAPEASLYIIGDGPERTKLEAEAATSGCSDKIHFTGFVKDPRPYLFAADIFVLASYREAFGLVLAHTVVAVPYVVMTMMAVLRNYDQRLDLAAQSLGAGPIATLRHVTFPILAAGMMSSFLFAFATSFDELTIALFSSGGLSATLPKQFWDEVTLQVSPVIAAVSTCLFVFIAALIFIAELLRRRAAAR